MKLGAYGSEVGDCQQQGGAWMGVHGCVFPGDPLYPGQDASTLAKQQPLQTAFVVAGVALAAWILMRR